MRKLAAFIAMCLLIVVGGGSALAAPGGTNRPFECSGEGVFTFDLSSHPYTVSERSSMNCTHLGLTTMTADAMPFSRAGATVPGVHVAANGDELRSTIHYDVDVSGLPGWFDLTNYVTFTGGTGRLEHASGSAVANVHAVITDNPMLYTSTFTIVGTISY